MSGERAMILDPRCQKDHVGPIDCIPWDRVQDNKTMNKAMGDPDSHRFGFDLRYAMGER